MALGQFRDSITVQQSAGTAWDSGTTSWDAGATSWDPDARDATGDPIEQWSTYCTRRASVEPLSGREYFAASQFQSNLSVRMRLHYDEQTALIDAKMRVSWGNRLFNIVAPPINPNEANREIILMCEET